MTRKSLVKSRHDPSEEVMLMPDTRYGLGGRRAYLRKKIKAYYYGVSNGAYPYSQHSLRTEWPEEFPVTVTKITKASAIPGAQPVDPAGEAPSEGEEPA
jgi:hypothetical protein